MSGIGILSREVGAFSGAKENELKLVTIVTPCVTELFKSAAGFGVEPHLREQSKKLHVSTLQFALRKVKGVLMSAGERLSKSIAAGENRLPAA
jgi:hypothetical protein